MISDDFRSPKSALRQHCKTSLTFHHLCEREHVGNLWESTSTRYTTMYLLYMASRDGVGVQDQGRIQTHEVAIVVRVAGHFHLGIQQRLADCILRTTMRLCIRSGCTGVLLLFPSSHKTAQQPPSRNYVHAHMLCFTTTVGVLSFSAPRSFL